MLPAYANIPAELKACLCSQEVASPVHKIPSFLGLRNILFLSLSFSSFSVLDAFVKNIHFIFYILLLFSL